MHERVLHARVKTKDNRLVSQIVEALGKIPNEAPQSGTGRTSQGVFLSYNDVSEIRSIILSGMKSYEIALRKLKNALPKNYNHDTTQEVTRD